MIAGGGHRAARRRRPGEARRGAHLQPPAQRRGARQRRAARQLPLQVRPAGTPPKIPPRRSPSPSSAPCGPGDYTLIVKLEDVNSGKVYREERPLSVPLMATAGARRPPRPALPRRPRPPARLAEADAALRSGETTIKLIPPFGELRSGMQRFDTLTTGPGIDKVTFVARRQAGADQEVAAVQRRARPRRRPAHPHARRRRLRRAGGHPGRRTSSRSTPPATASASTSSSRRRGSATRAACSPAPRSTSPRGRRSSGWSSTSTRRGSRRSTSPPRSIRSCCRRASRPAYVRAVAYLADGNSTESLVFVNAPEEMAQVNVDFVELYATVLDRKGHPVTSGLSARDFAVSEDGARQQIARCEPVTDLPIHAAVAIDISASMAPHLEKAQAAALQFLQGMVRAQGPRRGDHLQRSSGAGGQVHPRHQDAGRAASPASRPSAAPPSTTA